MKRMVSENLIAILKEMDSKGVSVSDLADMLEAFTDDEIQPTLTAGDNIQITEENVISATDTKYTAGDNITINDGVISASGGDVWENCVIFNNSSTNWALHFYTKEELTSDNLTTIIEAELNTRGLPIYFYNKGTQTGAMPNILTFLIKTSNKYYYTGIDLTNFIPQSYQQTSLPTLTLVYSHKIN